MITEKQAIRILFVNCQHKDMVFALRELNQINNPVKSILVTFNNDLKSEFLNFNPDVVIAKCTDEPDENLKLIQVFRSSSPHIPVIILSESQDENLAIACLKAGATDYVLKDHLIHLPYIISNVIEKQIVEQEKILTENQLREKEFIYNQIIENSNNAVFVIRNQRFESINTSFERMFEYSLEEVSGTNFKFVDLASPEYKVQVQEKYDNLLKGTGGRVQLQFHAISKTGKTLDVDAWIAYSTINNTCIIQGVITDITQNSALEKELRSSTIKFKSLFQDHSAAKLIVDSDNGQILDANYSAARFYGWDVEQLKNMNIAKLTHVPMPEVKIDVKVPAAGKEAFSEVKHLNSKGEIIDVEVFGSRINYGEKDALHIIIHDITARKRAEQKLHLLNHAVEQNPVAIVITNSEGTIEYVNPEFSSMTGYSFDEAVGKSPRILNSGYQDKDFYKNLWDTITSGNTWEGKFKNRKKGGELYWQESSISPIFDEHDKITHFVAVLEDITDEKKMIEDLVQAKEKAEESDRLKSAFLANMSHEIRTPMNGIIGFTDLLREHKLSGKEKLKYINIIKKSGERMLNTINDLIEISQIESGTTDIEYDSININDQMDAFYYQFANEARNKGINFTHTKGLPDAQAMIETDVKKLNSILSNLLKNALKYTFFGSIDFGYKKKNNDLEFYVNDTGIGIEANRHKIIFDRFVQADMSLTKPYEGAGLGLSIAKAYVSMLGGEIWLESNLGEGTKFFFTIPLRQKQLLKPEKDNIKTKEAEREYIKDLTILVAEDDAIGKLYIQELLEGSCKKLLFASDGYEALQLFRQYSDNIDIVLMDIKMPGMNGYETASLMKKINKHVYIIAQTAYALSGDREKAFASGCDYYLAKPFNKTQLIDAIKHLFE